MAERLPALDPSEARVLTFDFSADLANGETLSGLPSVTVTVEAGTDANPNGIVQQKSVDSDTHTTVLVAVDNLTDGVDYHIKVECATTNSQKALALAAILPVRAA